MRKLIALLFLAVISLAASCAVPSLQPLYTSETLIFDSALVGTWQDADGGSTYTISDDGDGGYDMLVANDNELTSYFTVHLAQFGGRTFLDVYPNPDDSASVPLGGYAPWDYAPLHNAYMVEQISPTLKLKRLSANWLESYVADNSGAVANGLIDLGDGESLYVLTGSTAELQAFYLAHIDNSEAYEALGEVTRDNCDLAARNIARTICSAEMAYYAMNGSYATLAQLAAPIAYIDETWATGQASGGITIELLSNSESEYAVLVLSPTGKTLHVDETGQINEVTGQ